MKRFVTIALALMIVSSIALAETNDDVAMIKQVITTAYVEGIHINRDTDAVKTGFSEDFAMIMKRDGKISRMTIQEWITRIDADVEKNPDRVMPETKAKFTAVEVAGDAAVARIELYKDGKLVYTDFMSLYRFDGGWKIIAKIYYRHPDEG